LRKNCSGLAYLGSQAVTDPSVHAAAHLAYALHNQAMAVLEGKKFSTAEAEAAIATVDRLCGENFTQRVLAAVDRAV